MNPLQEAVSSDFLDITSLFLEKVIQEQSRPKSIFPNLTQLLNIQTKNGSTIMSLVQSEKMKELLETFAKEDQENVPPKEGLRILKNDHFCLLVELYLSKYLALHCLPHTYGMFKEVKVDQVMTAAKEKPGMSLKLNSKQAKWGPC